MSKNVKLVLKVTLPGGVANGGGKDFVWPGEGETVEAPDWDPTPECGHGLHGWIEGSGDFVHTLMDPVRHEWRVLEVDADTIVGLGDKVKFPRAKVVYVGDQAGAVEYLVQHGAITAESSPGIACFHPEQHVEIARGAAERAKRYAASGGATEAQSREEDRQLRLRLLGVIPGATPEQSALIGKYRAGKR